MKSLFIAGTDTGVGKTIVTGLLAGYICRRGVRVVTQKWVQTGCAQDFSSDVRQHYRLMAAPFPAEHYRPDISPYVFRRACSPHLAARSAMRTIDARRIKESFRKLHARFECVLVESAGGVLVPFAGKRFLVDIAQELKLPVLLVSQNRLGAINQTLVNLEALIARKLDVIGIVFNTSRADEKYILEDNVRTVSRLARVPVLGSLAYARDLHGLFKAFAPIGRKIMRRLR